MSARKQTKLAMRMKRKMRGRKKMLGTSERPRLVVFRSLSNVYAQIVDDIEGKTLTAVSSWSKDNKKRANVARCKELGKALADLCKAKNISKVVFDKNGYAYHGRIKSLADGAREGGLKF